MLNRRQAIIWTNVVPIHWRIYAALGGDELRWRYTRMTSSRFLCVILRTKLIIVNAEAASRFSFSILNVGAASLLLEVMSGKDNLHTSWQLGTEYLIHIPHFMIYNYTRSCIRSNTVWFKRNWLTRSKLIFKYIFEKKNQKLHTCKSAVAPNLRQVITLSSDIYRKMYNKRRTKSQNINDSHLAFSLSLLNPFKPSVKSRMKM